MNSITIKMSAFLLLGITLFQSCKKDDDKKPGGSGGSTETCTNNGYTKYLKVGNKLEYEYLDLFSDDTTLTMEIVGTTSGGAYEFTMTGGGSLSTAGGNKRYMKECNDWVLVSASGEPVSSVNKTYKLVRSKGDTWTALTTNNYTVDEKNVSITTPAGIFVCDRLIYQQTGAFNTDTLYYSDEVGTVKYVGFLAEYQLKSKNF